jgi:putative endonuclease
MPAKGGFVYIISNKRRTVLYIGSTTDIKRRMLEHKTGAYPGFSKKYNCCDLLFYEFYSHIADAAKRETQMKAWKRDWKINLIQKDNPEMLDLSRDWLDEKGV